MTKDEHINYWINSSESDWLSALEIADKNERRHYALFIGHLSVEKMFKALFVKLFDSIPPYKHDLVILAEKCSLEIDNDTKIDLKMINEFNIQARYPDYKSNFYQKCTKEFVNEELVRIGRIRKWIQNTLENTR